ncbi:MAG TPA: hypothetical protein VMR37_03090 [Rhabdochlamydiaceae bacterium]|jgi:hypothetical protein|nr:hypothetical protein [Rhabdochlamydiaceae bacterium]
MASILTSSSGTLSGIVPNIPRDSSAGDCILLSRESSLEDVVYDLASSRLQRPEQTSPQRQIDYTIPPGYKPSRENLHRHVQTIKEADQICSNPQAKISDKSVAISQYLSVHRALSQPLVNIDFMMLRAISSMGIASLIATTSEINQYLIDAQAYLDHILEILKKDKQSSVKQKIASLTLLTKYYDRLYQTQNNRSPHAQSKSLECQKLIGELNQ